MAVRLRISPIVLTILVVAIAVWAPSARGAVPLDNLLILNAALLVTVALAPLPQHPRGLIMSLIVVFTAWLALLVFQQIPTGEISQFSAARFIDLSMMSVRPRTKIVVDQDGFFIAFGVATAGFLATWLGLALGAFPDKGRMFFKGVVYLSAIVVAVYLIIYRVDPTWLNFGIRENHGYYFAGGFVNKNNAATWLGSLLILSIGLWYQSYRRRNQSMASSTRHSSQSRDRAVAAVALPTLSVFVFLAGLILTTSRAGVTAALIGVFVLLYLVLVRGRQRYKGLLMAAVALVLALLVINLGDDLIFRFLATSDSDARYLAYAATLQLIGDYPWFGVGLGGFEDAFQTHRPIEFVRDFRWDRAHNVPLQLIAELGIPFATVIILAWIGVMVALCRQGFSKRRSFVMPFVGVAIMVQNSLHSLVDFSIQIPGYLALCGVILGAIIAAAFAPSKAK